MDVRVGDVLTMRKPHPCGERKFKVIRVGMDFKLVCCGCGHEIMSPRSRIEKNIKNITRSEEND
ncbi:MAG: DUF951 domain-containing protein [Clostridia bacterium]|nr:DUF951 domain-containing protein [Clostridia bacterium]